MGVVGALEGEDADDERPFRVGLAGLMRHASGWNSSVSGKKKAPGARGTRRCGS